MDEKIDIAVNIFAKPFQTSLSLLSLLSQSGSHVGTIWLQYEPVGSQYDPLTAYCIFEYLKEKGEYPLKVSQPDYWLDLAALPPGEMLDPARRMGIRYQTAFENSNARLLFLMHNDVFILKDILGAMKKEMGDAFAIGPLGQCWNCPAANAEIMAGISGPCTPDSYLAHKLDHACLVEIYKKADEKGIFARPYTVDNEDFRKQPWPLPECRINEWACLINLDMVRKFSIPFGPDHPPGAYRECGPVNLDIGVAWFRQMHQRGFTAKNFDTSSFMRHWVGTGKNTPGKYAKAEDNALRLLRRHFPAYIDWLRHKYQLKLPG